MSEQRLMMISRKVDSAPMMTKQMVTEDVVLVFGKRKPAAIINQSYVRADKPPIDSMLQFSKIANHWIQPSALSKFTILKSINPAIGLNLVQQVAHIVKQQIRISQPDISRLNQFTILSKPLYQIIQKNRAAPLLLQEDMFMQRSSRI